MPTLLVYSRQLVDNSEKSITPTTTARQQPTSNEKLILERQLAQGSIEAAYKLASHVESKHDVGGCCNCDIVANYYLLAFQLARNNGEFVTCNSLLLALVQQTAQLVQYHMEISRIQHLPWLPVLMSELRELGKQIKDSSTEGDRLVPLLPNLDFVSIDTNVGGGVEAIEQDYGRAIRTSIYHCRAVLCEDMDSSKAISYYRKCLSVRPTAIVESQKIQESAKEALRQIITEDNTIRPRLPSRTSSVSSGASSSCSMACANCGVEKRGMPVCSKCKSQYYCGVRCLKAHKPVHDLECSR
jgi:hypothetical protein